VSRHLGEKLDDQVSTAGPVVRSRGQAGPCVSAVRSRRNGVSACRWFGEIDPRRNKPVRALRKAGSPRAGL